MKSMASLFGFSQTYQTGSDKNMQRGKIYRQTIFLHYIFPKELKQEKKSVEIRSWTIYIRTQTWSIRKYECFSLRHPSFEEKNCSHQDKPKLGTSIDTDAVRITKNREFRVKCIKSARWVGAAHSEIKMIQFPCVIENVRSGWMVAHS